jgi:hypothetical protein
MPLDRLLLTVESNKFPARELVGGECVLESESRGPIVVFAA